KPGASLCSCSVLCLSMQWQGNWCTYLGMPRAPSGIIKKTRFPHWDEVLEFDLEEGVPGKEPKGSRVSVEVWDWDMVGKNDFLGWVEFSLDALQRSPAKGWFRLLPFPTAEEDLGALRLKVRLAEDRILPSMYYQPLIELLVESILPLALLEEISSVESRQDVATKLVKIFLGQGLAVPFLDYLNLREVTKTSKSDPNTLFRSNSLASKSMEQFMKVVGMPYLHEVLKPIINRIFEEKKYIELDPCKIELNRTRQDSLEMNSSGIQPHSHIILPCSSPSPLPCPAPKNPSHILPAPGPHLFLCRAALAAEPYIAISGFLFLRFFAPAILTPKLFNLRDQHADTRTSRTLLLLAKAVQSIGNLGLQLGHGKEQWMAPLHPFILPSITRVKDFLDKLIDVDSETGKAQPRTLFHPSVTIKEGYLHKRKAEGLHLLPRFTFKKRYFWLSSETLSYSKSPEWQVCVPPVPSRTETWALPLARAKLRDGRVMLAGGRQSMDWQNVNELNQWLSAIRKASICNEHMLPSCHPGAFRGNRWTCCLQPDRTVRGCSRTHSAMTLGDWSDPLDPDAETQMVYGQLLLGSHRAWGREESLGTRAGATPCLGRIGAPGKGAEF
uniref:RAS protein activator like 1 n=1 Tax=Terrapene triunguis TaxID=2587831 RepID=A0A674IAL3_9SAUR